MSDLPEQDDGLPAERVGRPDFLRGQFRQWMDDAVAAGKTDPTGAHRQRARDRGHGLAGKSTLNRLEGTPAEATAAARYKKIVYDAAAIERVFVEAFLDAHATPPAEIVLDLDATDDPLHGQQEGRFFHGYYRSYCYLPLYIFAGDFLLGAKLRTADGDGAAGAVEEVARLVGQIRERWPTVPIVVRADSGFAREELMAWCEVNRVGYVFGLARNSRLEAVLAAPPRSYRSPKQNAVKWSSTTGGFRRREQKQKRTGRGCVVVHRVKRKPKGGEEPSG